jgi:hypothetical protein
MKPFIILSAIIARALARRQVRGDTKSARQLQRQSSVLALCDGHCRVRGFYLGMRAGSSKNFLQYPQRDLSVSRGEIADRH